MSPNGNQRNTLCFLQAPGAVSGYQERWRGKEKWFPHFDDWKACSAFILFWCTKVQLVNCSLKHSRKMSTAGNWGDAAEFWCSNLQSRWNTGNKFLVYLEFWNLHGMVMQFVHSLIKKRIANMWIYLIMIHLDRWVKGQQWGSVSLFHSFK